MRLWYGRRRSLLTSRPLRTRKFFCGPFRLGTCDANCVTSSLLRHCLFHGEVVLSARVDGEAGSCATRARPSCGRDDTVPAGSERPHGPTLDLGTWKRGYSGLSRVLLAHCPCRFPFPFAEFTPPSRLFSCDEMLPPSDERSKPLGEDTPNQSARPRRAGTATHRAGKGSHRTGITRIAKSTRRTRAGSREGVSGRGNAQGARGEDTQARLRDVEGGGAAETTIKAKRGTASFFVTTPLSRAGTTLQASFQLATTVKRYATDHVKTLGCPAGRGFRQPE